MSGRSKAILLIALIAIGISGLVALERSGLIGGPKSDNLAWNGGAPADANDLALSEIPGPFNLVISQGDRVREIPYPGEAACERARDAETARVARRTAEVRRKGEGGDLVWHMTICLPESAR
jgi:hypothetical protein